MIRSYFFFSILLLKTFILFGQEIKDNYITFVQGDSSYKISKATDSVFLERRPFSLRYFGRIYDNKSQKFYSAQIAVLENQSDTKSLKIGTQTKDIPYFEPGTGMAPGQNGMYDTVVISNTGHHYLTYENEKEKRVFLISTNQKKFEFEWIISAVFNKAQDVQFHDLKLPCLFFVVFLDNNLNEVIDKGEMKIVKVIFK